MKPPRSDGAAYMRDYRRRNPEGYRKARIRHQARAAAMREVALNHPAELEQVLARKLRERGQQ